MFSPADLFMVYIASPAGSKANLSSGMGFGVLAKPDFQMEQQFLILFHWILSRAFRENIDIVADSIAWYFYWYCIFHLVDK